MREKLDHLKSIWITHGFRQLVEVIDSHVLTDPEFDDIPYGTVIKQCPEHMTFVKAILTQRQIRLKIFTPERTVKLLKILRNDSILDNYILNVSYYFLGMEAAQSYVKVATSLPYFSSNTAEEIWVPEVVMRARLEVDMHKRFEHLVCAVSHGSIEAYVQLAKYITENRPVYEPLKVLVDNFEFAKNHFANLGRNPLPRDYKIVLLSFAAEKGNLQAIKNLVDLLNVENGSGFSIRRNVSMHNNLITARGMPMDANHQPLASQLQQNSISEHIIPNNTYLSGRGKVNSPAIEPSKYMVDSVCGSITSNHQCSIAGNIYGNVPSVPNTGNSRGRGF
ncbi:MAG: hypothetical protein IPP74_01750 [Alphaproteobacteria bacterium]|nr:hypothetical protein [Alphaproteobacteria bacterium]